MRAKRAKRVEPMRVKRFGSRVSCARPVQVMHVTRVMRVGRHACHACCVSCVLSRVRVACHACRASSILHACRVGPCQKHACHACRVVLPASLVNIAQGGACGPRPCCCLEPHALLMAPVCPEFGSVSSIHGSSRCVWYRLDF